MHKLNLADTIRLSSKECIGIMVENSLIHQHYQTSKRIGVGGMGSVYLAEDTRTNHIVALKQLKPELITHDTSIVERFVREGEALRRLNHPNIVKVLDTFEEDGNYYIVMEYVSGGSLRDLLTDRPQMPIDDVLQIGLELADALSRAHHLRILHRDIKPANVLIAEDGTPRLTDFGIARLDDHSHLTETGALMGTFSYMSPEACQSNPVDTPADMWAFGVMLYEMLTGVRPFDGDQLPGTIFNILNNEPQSIRSVRPDIPQSLATLIHQLLEKDPSKRLSSARLVGAQLEAIIQGNDTPTGEFASRFDTPTPAEGTVTLPPLENTPTHKLDIPIAEAQASGNRRMMWIGMAVIALLVLIGGVLASGVLNPPPIEPTAQAQLVATVEPVVENEYMVLVAQLENTGGSVRPATRFVADDLRDRLENDLAYTRVKVRELNQVITSDAEAQQLAQVNGADVIVWGRYNASSIVLEVQVGSLDKFIYNPFERDLLEQTANITVQITDELSQSVVPNVLGILATQYLADGDIYRWARAIAAIGNVNKANSQIIGPEIPGLVHSYYLQFLQSDTSLNNDILGQEIPTNSKNPFLFALRGLHKLSTFNGQEPGAKDTSLKIGANRDKESLLEVAPNWIGTHLLIYFVRWSDVEADEAYLKISNQRDDEWYIHFINAIDRAGVGGGRDLNIESLMIAHQNNTESFLTLPFFAFTGFASGDLAFISANIQSIPTENTLIEMEIATVLWGRSTNSVVVPIITNAFLLNQFEETIDLVNDNIDRMSNTRNEYEKLILFLALAECEIRRESATTSLPGATELLGNSIYLIQGMINLKLSNSDLAELDFQRALNSPLGEQLAPYVYGAQEGILTCANIFDPSAIAQAEQAYANRPQASVEPVADNEYMVLVADFEQLGGDTRDVQRFIVDDLRQHFESEVSYAQLRVRALDEVVTSSEQASALAQVNGATFIIWGQYNAQGVRARLQLGNISKFVDNHFEPDLLQATINSEHEITDLIRQSLSRPIVSSLLMMHIAGTDVYSYGELLVASDTLKVVDVAPYAGNTKMGAVTDALALWISDDMTPTIDLFDLAIAEDTDNPLLYGLRGAAWARERNLRLGVAGLSDLVEQDVTSAEQFADNDQWLFPNFSRQRIGFTPTTSTEILASFEILENDWYFETLLLRGLPSRIPFLELSDNIYDVTAEANGHLETLPHLLTLALYNVDMEAVRQVGDALTQVEDLARYEAVLDALFTYNPQIDNLPSIGLGYLSIGQYSTALEKVSGNDVGAIVAIQWTLTRIVRGLANCNLDDVRAIDDFQYLIDRDMTFGYLMQGMFYRGRGQGTQMNDVLALAETSPQGDLLQPYIETVRDGRLTCATLLDATKINEIINAPS